ncbi:hypothetical protein G7046_g7841 [Stylonectria norvegica]|nr:hypothetical protein G7046_g7841 [Stylonectria norvegica]
MSTDNAQSDPSESVSLGTEPLACVSCRARKLKCDRVRPSCGRCVKVSNECMYPESRRKPTFKRRNVKELEARLAQVEDYLKEVNKPAEDKADDESPTIQDKPHQPNQPKQSDQPDQPDQPDAQFSDFTFGNGFSGTGNGSRCTSDTSQLPFNMPSFDQQPNPIPQLFENSQLMGLGMTEALPPFEVMEELISIFFHTRYFFIPVVHPGRFLQSFYGGPMRKPPMCLQYAIWAMAANGHERYDQYHEGHGELFITIGHAQAWALIASYEAKCMLFTRAAMSSAKCVRLCHMMGLDRIDGEQDELPPTLSAPLSWAELEERRRVFWGAFSIDSHASIATGWPSLINSDDVTTRLPASEEAFIADRKEEAPFLYEVFHGAPYTGFAGTMIVCQIFKTILHHVHRSKPHDRPEDVMHGPFWVRHRELDNKLSSIFMFLPDKLRLPQNIRDATATHTNLNLHACIICLHHAAIEKAVKHNLHSSIKTTSVYRLRAAAEEISNIMKLNTSTANFRSPLCALSLYCAVTVYVYIAKEDPLAGLTPVDIANMEMLIAAMEAIARVHEITRAFLQQACRDVEENGLADSIRLPTLNQYRDAFAGASSTIPVISRSSVSRHTEVSPVLPGRLPLGNPKGSIRPGHLKVDKGSAKGFGGASEKYVDQLMRDTMNRDCFQAVLGAVSRNVAANRPNGSTHKRKRRSPSPAPDPSGDIQDAEGPEILITPMSLSGLYRPAGTLFQRGPISLPDRTTPSSASSPAYQGPGSGNRTEVASDSSHTSPSLGLGNTVEDNRIDLRNFQNQISTPVWQATEETFLSEITESMVGSALATDGSDPWGILNANNVDWGNVSALI